MKRWYRDEAFLWSLALVGGLGFMGFFNRKRIVAAVSDVVTRGNLLSKGSYDESLGVVVDAPELLREMAILKLGRTISRDTYAAARMIRSEGAKEGGLRLHVAMNDLRKFPYANNLFELLTYSTDPKRRGFFGAQWSPAKPPLYPKRNARRYATKRDPYAGDVLAAETAIAERVRGIDRANGATKFIDRSDMGKQLGTVSFDQKDAEWRGDGYQPFTIAEYGTDLVLYRKA